MAWLLLEAGVAGLLFVLIIYWTLPKKPKKTGPHDENGKGSQDS
jgi:hypothetical protein